MKATEKFNLLQQKYQHNLKNNLEKAIEKDTLQICILLPKITSTHNSKYF